ncbi:MAG: hypothetical protein NT013_29125 [Planctomycetia bacterium]|nr:hypothetical protein [Planctomycetia bacterium]
MSYQRNLAVIHFSEDEIEQAQVMRRRIREALSRGRNVALICDIPQVGRMERLTFACLSVRDLPGRFAIVAQNANNFTDTMPIDLRDRLQVFESEEAAFEWLDPNPEDSEETLMDLSAN